MNYEHSSFFRTSFLAAGLVGGLCIGVTATAEEKLPEAHSDGIGAMISDTAITANVKAKLMAKDGVDHSDINVTTTNGVVTLKGKAGSTDAAHEAAEAAREVEGVKSVYNGLVTPSSSEAEANTKKAIAKTKSVVSDSWITTKVKSQLLGDNVSRSFNITVDTKGGVVILKGALDNQDAIDHVKDIASNTEGVKSVDTSALSIKSK